MKRITVLMVAALVLAACTSQGPEQAVADYFEALVAGNATTARELSCADYEAIAQSRIDTFANLDAELVDMACRADGETEDGTRVTCDGHIAVTYGTEDQELALGSYLAVQEGGAWRMCGETE